MLRVVSLYEFVVRRFKGSDTVAVRVGGKQGAGAPNEAVAVCLAIWRPRGVGLVDGEEGHGILTGWRRRAQWVVLDRVVENSRAGDFRVHHVRQMLRSVPFRPGGGGDDVRLGEDVENVGWGHVADYRAWVFCLRGLVRLPWRM